MKKRTVSHSVLEKIRIRIEHYAIRSARNIATTVMPLLYRGNHVLSDHNFDIETRKNWLQSMHSVVTTVSNPFGLLLSNLIPGEIDDSNEQYTIHTPPEVENDPVVYVHGSGYVFLGSTTYAAMLKQLALETKSVVYAIKYPKLNKSSFVQIENTMVENIKALPFTPKVLGGDSAGGGSLLRLASNQKLSFLGDNLRLFLLSPWVTLSPSSKSAYKNDDPLLHQKIVYSIYQEILSEEEYVPMDIDDLSMIESLYLLCSEGEVLFEDAIMLYEQAKKQNVPGYFISNKDSWHVYPIFHPLTTRSGKTLKGIARFINKPYDT